MKKYINKKEHLELQRYYMILKNLIFIITVSKHEW